MPGLFINMEDITCQRCGLVNDYTPRNAGPHISAYCNGCGNYIKHLPQNNPVELMPFGKYKGRELKTLTSSEEVRYLQWFIQMPDLKPRIKEAIEKHLIAL
jgi:hypothetical protein